ncbi:Exopolygalacturonase rpg16 [Choanephora cucurbitarum]|uniref:Exopolygalacturonase rpg16 n=1 Tax=Choanephora cucurbitarum TaxID=101091 RepID=A0A1C7NSH2_9FUNG|nr:Exopolygalacturonase rpg16 [Choanephora cucurbitarum]
MVYVPSISSALAIVTVLASAAQAATCVVSNSGNVANNIVSAFSNCKNGGTVVFSKGTTYNLNDLVTVQGLNGVNVQFYGTLNLPAYSSKFKNQSAYLIIKGQKIKFDGGNTGVINGNGQQWWDAKDKSAPTVLRITATGGSTFSNFKILQAPRAHIGVTSSSDVIIDKITLNTVSKSSNDAHNTDGIDISNSKNITWSNSVVRNGDDCMAINGNTSNVKVNNVQCTGSHGFSVGSLGKGGENDVVSGIVVTNSKCTDCQNGLRIKTWPGGKGSVSNVQFSGVQLNNVDNPILITTHYCDNNQMSYCKGNDNASLTIKDVQIKSISGSASSAGKPVLSINCSKNTPCSGFSVSGINVTKNSKTKKNECINLNGANSISYCSQ